MSIVLSEFSVEQLVDLKKEIEKEFKGRAASIHKNARAEINEIARKYGLSIEEILSGKAAGSAPKKTVSPKYRNPQNTNETWTGRGVKPVWLASAISEGRSIEEFLISA